MKRLIIPKVSTEELTYAYAVGGLAADGTIPQSGVAGMGVNIATEDGGYERLEVTDIPMNRAAVAIRDQFPKGMLQPLLMRLWAMNEMIALPDSAPFIRTVGDQQEVSEALFFVAARMPLNPKGTFNSKQYFQQVAARFAEDDDLSSGN